MNTGTREVAQEIRLPDGYRIVLLDRLAKQNVYGTLECARNVFLLDDSQRVIWQVRTAFDVEGAPFTNLLFDGVELTGYRWDGGYYLINLQDGQAVPTSLAK